ncbi:urea transporter 1-like [Branchiostoma floridae x Branchiostoma belcheri]
MADVFAMLQLPVLAFPFCLGTLMFLGVTSDSRALQKVPLSQVTYPEEHRRRFKRNALVPANPN